MANREDEQSGFEKDMEAHERALREMDERANRPSKKHEIIYLDPEKENAWSAHIDDGSDTEEPEIRVFKTGGPVRDESKIQYLSDDNAPNRVVQRDQGVDPSRFAPREFNSGTYLSSFEDLRRDMLSARKKVFTKKTLPSAFLAEQNRPKKKIRGLKTALIGTAIVGGMFMAADLGTHAKNILTGSNNRTATQVVAEAVYNTGKNVAEKVGDYAVFRAEAARGEVWQDVVFVDGEAQKNKDGTLKMERHRGDLLTRVLTLSGTAAGATWDEVVAEPSANAYAFWTGNESEGAPSGKQVTPTKASDFEDSRGWSWWPYGDNKKEEKCYRARRGGISGVVSRAAAGINQLVWGDDDKFLIIDDVKDWYNAELAARRVRENTYASAAKRRWIPVPDYLGVNGPSKFVTRAKKAKKSVIQVKNGHVGDYDIPVDDSIRPQMDLAARLVVGEVGQPTSSDSDTDFYKVSEYVSEAESKNVFGLRGKILNDFGMDMEGTYTITVIDEKKDYGAGGKLDAVYLEAPFGNFHIDL